MAVETYLSTTFAHKTEFNVSGSAALLALLDAWFDDNGWTLNGGYSYKSPTDADGRYMTLIFAAIDASVVSFQVRNHNNQEVATRGASFGGIRRVQFYIGTHHFALDTLVDKWAFGEALSASILDQTPFAQSSNLNYCHWGFGSRRSSDWTQYNPYWRYAAMRDYYYSTITVNNWDTRIAELDNGGGNTNLNISHNGFPIHYPYEFVASVNSSENKRWVGRSYQMMLFPNRMLDRDSTIIVPIGTAGEVGTFRCISGMYDDGRRMSVVCRIA